MESRHIKINTVECNTEAIQEMLRVVQNLCDNPQGIDDYDFDNFEKVLGLFNGFYTGI